MSEVSCLGPFLGGIPVGLLVGVLLGMTTNPIAASVAGSLMTLLVAFSTIRGERVDETNRRKGVPPHIAGFSLAAAASTLFSLHLRTHETLGTTPDEVAARWRAAGLSEYEAQSAALASYGLQVRSSRADTSLVPPGESCVAPTKGVPAQDKQGQEGGIEKGKPEKENAEISTPQGRSGLVGLQSVLYSGGDDKGVDPCSDVRLLDSNESLESVRAKLTARSARWKEFVGSDVRSDETAERWRLRVVAVKSCQHKLGLGD